ncbi:hypothetical protein ARHIZOSPH14_03280 [Agromyces rhizosphaerae]|uniref:Hemagglutinin n=1 Tax=Agromyces rhizosphaerae TaxID=88374 RepID=A0A9W6FN36_9MICO|nr:hypothetical protein ARHIZOSPH14_03280 [Agromyces rhizosphaerae]
MLSLALVASAAVLGATRADAADASDFDAGYIVSDAVFYDAYSMDAAAVQRFLEARVPTCRATTGPACLKDYRTATPTRAAEAGRCDQYLGKSSETAAQIIVRVGRVCGVSPKALIVLLEKEQSLVTATAPSSRQYRSATGYGCPDTADCDSTYYGFFNQVYAAALQFKRYAAAPSGRAYVAGRDNAILYHPNTACGTKSVYIRNQATAGLYLYTPYTPNRAALANLYGAGDSCSSYGNRNFWRIFSDWFGSPTGGGSPRGELTTARTGYHAIRVAGWATDIDTPDPIRVHVYVDGKGRASVAADDEEPGSTRSRGFSVVVGDLDPGDHRVCVWAIDVGVGKNVRLGCRTLTVKTGSPGGYVDEITGVPGAIEFRGWAIDPDTPDPIRVHVYVDGKGRASLLANETKPGFDDAKPGYGDDHAFSGRIEDLGPGTHRVCFYAIDVGPGSTRKFACRDVLMPSGSPVGEITSSGAPGIGVIEVEGWTVDPDTVDPIRVHLYVDGKGAASVLADEEVDGSLLPSGYGTAHGFSATLEGYAPGVHRVCAYGIDVGEGRNRKFGCVDVEMPTGSPKGVIDEMAPTGESGELMVRGWALDPDTVDPIRVHLYVDGSGAASIEAGLEKTGLSEVYPGMGDFHGFQTVLTGLTPGDHRICVYAIDKVDPGSNTLLGCRTKTVP